MRNLRLHFSACLLFTALLTLNGCGGGGSASSGTNQQPQTGTTTPPVWTFGEFAPASQYAHFCQAPRTGVDPYANNQPYPDVQGTAMHEKMWLRSFSNETYLWYDEVADNNPADFNSVIDYFNQLKTFALTPAGREKDEFHFYESYESFQKEAQSGVTSGYGIRWAAISPRPPRNFTVASVEPNSPAATAGVVRGDQIQSIDGINFISSDNVSALQAALSPKLGDSHNFVFRALDGSQKSVTLTSSDIETTPVDNAKVLSVAGKKVGYVQFNQFIPTAQTGLINAFSQFQTENIDELVLDMRYNGGGRLIMAAQLGYMIAGSKSRDRAFSVTTLNDKRSAENSITEFETREIDWLNNQFKNNQLPTVNLNKVYILTTFGTASASENVINGLRGIDVDVILIGSATRGKPYGFVPEQNCGTVYYTVQFKSENEKGFGDYADGFIPVESANTGEIGLNATVPGCTIADDFNHQLGELQEGQLAAALTHIETGNCPEITISNSSLPPKYLSKYRGTEHALSVPSHPMHNGTIMMPRPREAQ
ncbi:S41 family peptidase [Pseudoalteromonas sp. T1lg65]|uniref:S41 family peptidase n=1 Tax=Pseudoalteromonas sp. T1lg65 TaxID=2077101 RepID=UPI003F7974E2